MIYHIDITSSTNDLARDAKYTHLDVVWAEHQTAGRGQRGHSWHSTEGENITFSVVLIPSFLPIVEQFLLSEIVALALVDTMAHYGICCRIKWTNDIYAADNKIAGVLIEHSLSGESIARTIVGIGLNINQREFPDDIPNPTSMALERGMMFNREEVLEHYVATLRDLYAMLERGEKEAIEARYITTMYHLAEEHTYAYASGERFRATIRGVRPTGHLCLEHRDGTIVEYAFKEVEFVLPHKEKK
ncbi:MAG: biotin--[acetyl-CoA-carboxylase] ligase [Alistipes sp.]|nr:biotin--[acetyl-CoA-carboxylase] ligase [Alistipes sp.]